MLIRLIEDSNGDLVDIDYYCSTVCGRDVPEAAPWPGYEAIDHPANCSECGDPVGNALTGAGEEYLREMVADPNPHQQCYVAEWVDAYPHLFDNTTREIYA
jgi:hypothetical protein